MTKKMSVETKFGQITVTLLERGDHVMVELLHTPMGAHQLRRVQKFSRLPELESCAQWLQGLFGTMALDDLSALSFAQMMIVFLRNNAQFPPPQSVRRPVAGKRMAAVGT